MKISAALFFLLSISLIVDAQISPERLAQTRMEKGKWVKAHYSIKKAIRKDSVNPEAKLVYAQWYFKSANPDFHIDSAYKYTLASLHDYTQEDQRQRERMSRFPLDSLILIQLREQIDSAAFERAKNINTEASYISFLEQFTYAKQKESAIELRDEVAFLDALKVNTYQSFYKYLNKYPKSLRVEEATARYEKLLFEEKTNDGKLKSFITFHHEYPESPFRRKVEEQIFLISTASGEIKDYLNFITKFKEATPLVKTARDIVYHLSRQLELEVPKQILSDSLKRVILIEEGFWVPFLKNDLFGFIDENGKEMISARYKDIADDYLCGNITDDFITTSAGLVSRTGSVIHRGKIQNVEDLGFGFLWIEGVGCNKIIHKSGFRVINDCIDDARIIANHFLAIQKNKKWRLYSFSGHLITDQVYDNIESEEEIVVMSRKSKKIIYTIHQLVSAADKNPLPENMVFDDVKKLSTNNVLVKNGALEGVINADLKFEIALDRQILTLTSFGFTKRVLNKVSTVGLSPSLDKEEFNDIKPYLNWLGLYRPSQIQLYHQPSSQMIDEQIDSLWFTNRLAMALKGDSLKVFFASGRKMSFSNNTKVTFVKSPDSVRYFYFEDKGKKQLFEVDSGIKRFTFDFDHLEDLGYQLFLVDNKGKKGLIGIDGRIVLPIEYDAIVKSAAGIISLLKDKKFGVYDLRARKLIKANYERNLTFYNESILVAFKEGYYGFIDKDANPISEFEFEEVRPWSDSSAMVKKNFRWMVYGIYSGRIDQSSIKDYQLIKDTMNEKIAIIHVDNEYGVISSVKGVILPATYSDILNLGTPEKPLYFTEKSVEEAGIFVVIYYNQKGELIRREIYESDEYDQIYCR